MTHVCKCAECDPSLQRTGPRQGPDHVAVRFGKVDAYCKVYLEGKEVARAFEAMGGVDGWVLRYCQPEHVCKCRKGACAEVVHGFVQVVRPPVFDRPTSGNPIW